MIDLGKYCKNEVWIIPTGFSRGWNVQVQRLKPLVIKSIVPMGLVRGSYRLWCLYLSLINECLWP